MPGVNQLLFNSASTLDGFMVVRCAEKEVLVAQNAFRVASRRDIGPT